SINHVLDEHYSRNLGFLISGGLREKQSQHYLVGIVPFGYMRPPGETRLVVPHPTEAPAVLEVFERYATGRETYGTIADWLSDHGFRGKRGRPFTKDTVREILANGVYAGLVAGRRGRVDPNVRGIHEPIISPELFEQVKSIRARRGG